MSCDKTPTNSPRTQPIKIIDCKLDLQADGSILIEQKDQDAIVLSSQTVHEILSLIEEILDSIEDVQEESMEDAFNNEEAPILSKKRKFH